MSDGDTATNWTGWQPQFEPTGQIPKQKEPEPEPESEPEPEPEPEPDRRLPSRTVSRRPPRPPYQPPPIVPRAPADSGAAAGGASPRPRLPSTKPIDPRGLLLPTAALAQTPPPAVVPVPDGRRAAPPVRRSPADRSDTVPAPAAGGFAWGLRPSDPAAASETPSEPTGRAAGRSRSSSRRLSLAPVLHRRAGRRCPVTAPRTRPRRDGV